MDMSRVSGKKSVFSPTPRRCLADTKKCLKISVAAFGLRDQSQNLISGQRDDAEHQMAHHLGVAAHADHAPPKLVFQTRIHPLHGGAFAVTHVFGAAIAKELASLLLSL